MALEAQGARGLTGVAVMWPIQCGPPSALHDACRARREASLSGSERSSGGGGSGPSSACSAGGSTSFGDADGTAFGMPRGGGSDPGSDAFGVLHGSSERLSDVYFSYAAASPGPSSPKKRPGSGMPGSPLAGGRPRMAALAARQSLQRPVSALGRAWG